MIKEYVFTSTAATSLAFSLPLLNWKEIHKVFMQVHITEGKKEIRGKASSASLLGIYNKLMIH